MIDDLATVAMETPAATAHHSLTLSSTSPAQITGLKSLSFAVSLHPSFINLSFSQTHKGQPPRHVTVSASPIMPRLFHIHSVPKGNICNDTGKQDRERNEKVLEMPEMPFKRK